MGLGRVRLAKSNVDVTAVGLPAGFAGGKVLIGVGNTPVVFLAELVFRRVWIGIAPEPELFDERVAFLVVAKGFERFALVVGDDIGHVLVKPGLVGALQFLPNRLLSLPD